jgi:hypothetical protein
MAKDTPIFDFDNPGVRMMAKRMIDALRGLCVFHAHRLRDQRTLTQLAYLWSVVYPHVAAGLTEVWGEGEVDAEGAHIECGLMFLSKPTVDRRTGEVRPGRVRSTSELTTVEFADYTDKVIRFASEYLDVNVPPPTRDRSQWVKPGKATEPAGAR